MERYTIAIAPEARRTRLLLMRGPDELLRAALPPQSRMWHERSAATLLEGLSLWLDAPLCAVLVAGAKDASFCLGLTDELGRGVRSLHYTVEVAEPQARREVVRLRGVAQFDDLHRVALRSGDGR